MTRVRRAFRLLFISDRHREVPTKTAFHRLVRRFKMTGSLRPITSPGRAQPTADEVKKVEQFFAKNSTAHVREASHQLGMSFGKVWRILRKTLKWKPWLICVRCCHQPTCSPDWPLVSSGSPTIRDGSSGCCGVTKSVSFPNRHQTEGTR